MNFATLLARNSGRATPSLHCTPKAHHTNQANPAENPLIPSAKLFRQTEPALSDCPTDQVRQVTHPTLHPTTRAALRSYAERRDAHLGSRCGPHFFVAERGGRLLHQYVHRVFWRLSREIGLRRPGDHSGPRMHDFRHRFAIRTLLGWYGEGTRCRAAASGALHLSRPRLRARHLLVSLGLSGVDGRGSAASRSAVGGQAMKPNSNLATLIERYFTERLMRHAMSRQHDRILQGYIPAAVHVCTCATPQTAVGLGARRSGCAFYQRVS